MKYWHLSVVVCIINLMLLFRAYAHPLTQGAMVLSPQGNVLHLELKAPLEQITVERLANYSGPDQNPREQWNAHAQYILGHLHISQNGASLVGVVNENEPPVQRGGFVHFSFHFAGLSKGGVEISQDILREIEFAPGNPWESTYVVSNEGVAGSEHLVTSAQQPVTIPVGEDSTHLSQNSISLGIEYFFHGVHHILTGYDHLLFVCGLALTVTSLMAVVGLVATFTIAHSVTLALSTFDIVNLPSSVVEPLIALSIIVVATFTVIKPTTTSLWKLVPIVFFFGLFHGLGFAGGLKDAMSDLPTFKTVISLLGFSCGVEVGHQLVLVPFLVLLALADLMVPKTEKNRVGQVRRVGAVMVGVGGFYFLYGVL